MGVGVDWSERKCPTVSWNLINNKKKKKKKKKRVLVELGIFWPSGASVPPVANLSNNTSLFMCEYIHTQTQLALTSGP